MRTAATVGSDVSACAGSGVCASAAGLSAASAARALQNGAQYIERADKLVQLIARQKGLRNPAIDAQVALVDARLEANRKKAAA